MKVEAGNGKATHRPLKGHSPGQLPAGLTPSRQFLLSLDYQTTFRPAEHDKGIKKLIPLPSRTEGILGREKEKGPMRGGSILDKLSFLVERATVKRGNTANHRPIRNMLHRLSGRTKNPSS